MPATVLVVEDDPSLRELYRGLLADAGHDVRTTATGAEAVTVLESELPEVVVSDIVMPELDGIELLRAVRRRDLDLPVILVTGSPTLDSATRAVEYGAFRYLLKPVKGQDLLDAVAQALRVRRVAQVRREAFARFHIGQGVGDRAGLEAHFEGALQAVRMAYQPIVRPGGAVFAHEALLRCPSAAFPDPPSLIEAALRLDRLPDLSRTLRTLVARDLPRLQPQGAIFVNLHPHDLLDPRLLATGEALAAEAPCIVLEITERAPLESVPGSFARIGGLKGRGFRIALDDLGAGYAGLSSFAVLQPDIVKLDMELIRGVERDPVRYRLVGALVSACRDLGILVVAEGVETEPERDALVTLGCDLLQGHLFGRPQGLP